MRNIFFPHYLSGEPYSVNVSCAAVACLIVICLLLLDLVVCCGRLVLLSILCFVCFGVSFV